MNSFILLLVSTIFIYSSVFALPTINTLQTLDNNILSLFKSNYPHKFIKRQDVQQTEEFKLAYKKCNESTIEYDNCFPVASPNVENLDELCSEYKTEKCQEYGQKGLSMIPGCQNEVLKDFVKMYNGLIHYIYFSFHLTCGTDESGNYCPLSEQILNEMKDAISNSAQTMELKEKNYYNNTMKTCESQLCVDAYVNFYENREAENKKFFETVVNSPSNTVANNYGKFTNNTQSSQNNNGYNIQFSDGFNKFKQFKRDFHIENYKNYDLDKYINDTLTYLKSDECIALRKTNNTNTSSSTLQYSTNISITLITIAIILFTLI